MFNTITKMKVNNNRFNHKHEFSSNVREKKENRAVTAISRRKASHQLALDKQEKSKMIQTIYQR